MCPARKYGARILRLSQVQDFSLHDITLVDGLSPPPPFTPFPFPPPNPPPAPQFHLFLATCTNGEIYNTLIRGGSEGGLDGIDVSGSTTSQVSNRERRRHHQIPIAPPSSSSRSTATGPAAAQSVLWGRIQISTTSSMTRSIV